MWAFIYYLQSKATKICETIHILQFSVDEYGNDKNNYLKNLFFTRWPNQDPASEPVPIYVLVVEALETRIKEERPKIPKIRHSAQYAKYEPSEDEDDPSQDTNKQKEQKKVATQKMEEAAIIEAHLKSSSKQKSYKKADPKNSEKHNSSSKKEPLMSIQSEKLSDELKRTKLKLHETNQELKETLEKLKEANTDIESLETENSILKRSETTKPFTENSPVIVELLEKVREMHKYLFNDNRELSITSNSKENKTPVSLFETQGLKTYLGNNEWINSTTLSEIMREKEASGVFTKSCYSLWELKDLVYRVVKLIKKNEENLSKEQKKELKKLKELTPSKKNAVLNIYEKWLKNREIPSPVIMDYMESKKKNKLFNGSITAARKRLSYSKDRASDDLKIKKGKKYMNKRTKNFEEFTSDNEASGNGSDSDDKSDK